ncbi:MAG: hypothetical protein KatS3mg035_0040 [Bacteroidia bacterium]|nr:MAG: hypothetical protein KatS3mg035_0040 [Bacteroidia bacterium]
MNLNNLNNDYSFIYLDYGEGDADIDRQDYDFVRVFYDNLFVFPNTSSYYNPVTNRIEPAYWNASNNPIYYSEFSDNNDNSENGYYVDGKRYELNRPPAIIGDNSNSNVIQSTVTPTPTFTQPTNILKPTTQSTTTTTTQSTLPTNIPTTPSTVTPTTTIVSSSTPETPVINQPTTTPSTISQSIDNNKVEEKKEETITKSKSDIDFIRSKLSEKPTTKEEIEKVERDIRVSLLGRGENIMLFELPVLIHKIGYGEEIDSVFDDNVSDTKLREYSDNYTFANLFITDDKVKDNPIYKGLYGYIVSLYNSVGNIFMSSYILSDFNSEYEDEGISSNEYLGFRNYLIRNYLEKISNRYRGINEYKEYVDAINYFINKIDKSDKVKNYKKYYEKVMPILNRYINGYFDKDEHNIIDIEQLMYNLIDLLNQIGYVILNENVKGTKRGDYLYIDSMKAISDSLKGRDLIPYREGTSITDRSDDDNSQANVLKDMNESLFKNISKSIYSEPSGTKNIENESYKIKFSILSFGKPTYKEEHKKDILYSLSELGKTIFDTDFSKEINEIIEIISSSDLSEQDKELLIKLLIKLEVSIDKYKNKDSN